MSVPINPNPETQSTEQKLQNLSFDTLYNVLAFELLAQDGVNGVLRRVQTDSSGHLQVTDAGSDVQKFFDYASRIDDKAVYIGYGSKGIATSDPTWLVLKFNYDASNRITSIQSATGVYDNRASLTYS